VLEVGCGQGPLVNHLPQFGASIVGLDMSDASLRRAAEGVRELGNHSVRLLQGDAERLPFADHSFDSVVSFGVLHHTPDTDGAIQEVRRVLKPGGTAIVMLYRSGNPKSFATRVLRWIGRTRDRRTASEDTLADRSRAHARRERCTRNRAARAVRRSDVQNFFESAGARDVQRVFPR
jgi:ubiquinone/menaquinone biosynthesis C-methylase UbiE